MAARANRAQAVKRSVDDPEKGSQAMNGAATMRPALSQFGRFTGGPRRSGQRLEHELAHRAQRLEHAVAADRYGFEVLGTFHPLTRGEPLDEVLACVIR